MVSGQLGIVKAAAAYSKVSKVGNWWTDLFFPNYMRIRGATRLTQRAAVLLLLQKKYDKSVSRDIRSEVLYGNIVLIRVISAGPQAHQSQSLRSQTAGNHMAIMRKTLCCRHFTSLYAVRRAL